VLTYSSFLMKRTQDRPDIQDDLKVIVRETIRSREIVRSLLDFARQSVPKKNEADIHEIIERAVHVVHNQLTVNQIKLQREFATDLPKLTVDANQMQQVLLNLIVNAIDAIGPQGGTLTITTSDLKLSPYGITQIRKATCPKRHSLMDGQVRIGGLPAVRVKIKSGIEEGHGFLDPVYGRHNHQYSIPVEPGTVMQVHCPECSSSLVEPSVTCPKCSAPIVRFEVASQGLFETCSRRGCDWQRWDAMDRLGQREYAQIAVADTGCGISQEDVQRIFEPFFTTKGQKGTGLGLAVIWGIVDNHDGTITVQSELQKGTTFTIRLPIGHPR
jgi:signal transduction histidine kinase